MNPIVTQPLLLLEDIKPEPLSRTTAASAIPLEILLPILTMSCTPTSIIKIACISKQFQAILQCNKDERQFRQSNYLCYAGSHSYTKNFNSETTWYFRTSWSLKADGSAGGPVTIGYRPLALQIEEVDET